MPGVIGTSSLKLCGVKYVCLLTVAGVSLSVAMEAVGLYDFNPTGSDELCFKKGDVLKVRWAARSTFCISHLSVQRCLVLAVFS